MIKYTNIILSYLDSSVLSTGLVSWVFFFAIFTRQWNRENTLYKDETNAEQQLNHSNVSERKKHVN